MQTYEFSKLGLEMAFNDSKIQNQIKNHFKRNAKIYITVTLLAGGFTLGINDFAEAASGIDAGGKKIYSKLILVGKWVIIVKGGIDTIQNTLNGDFQSAKGNFLKYLMTYGVLLALPWGMDQIEGLFN